MTQQALIAYSIGLMGLIQVKIRHQVFMPAKRQNAGKNRHDLASGDTGNEPIFIWQLRHAGLALSIGLGFRIQRHTAISGLRRHGYSPPAGLGAFMLKNGTGHTADVRCIVVGGRLEDPWHNGGLTYRSLKLFGVIIPGVAIYFPVHWQHLVSPATLHAPGTISRAVPNTTTMPAKAGIVVCGSGCIATADSR